MTSTESRSPAVLSIAPVALVVVVPLSFLPGAFGPFHAVKWLAVCVIVPAGLAVCAALGRLRWPRWQWFVPLVVVSVLATVFGVAPVMSVFGSPNRNDGLIALALGIGAFVLGVSACGDPTVQRRVLRAAFVTGGLVGVLAVAERLGLDVAGLGDAGEVSRARSTWGSATFAAAHLVVVLPIAVAHLRSRDSRWRIAGLVCSVAILAGLLATGTRGGWLAALVSVAVLAPAWLATGRPAEGSAVLWSAAKRENSPGVDQRRTGGPILVVAGVVAAVAAAGVLVLTVVGPELDRASGIGRLDLWSTTPSVIADRPILGAGPDTQRSVLPAGIDEDFEREHGSEELHDRAHSLPLDTLVTTGILGLAALVALLGVLARDFVSNLRRELVPTAIAAGLAGYLVTLLFAFGDPVMDPIPWMLAGLLWVAIVPSSGERSTEQPRSGVRMIATGGNPEAVRRVGINANAYKLLGFVLSGLLAALAGLMQTALVTEASPQAGPGIIFQALTAVALAGVSLAGGRGSLPKVLVGAIVLATIADGLTIKGVPPYWATVSTGVLMIGALMLDKVLTHTISERLVAIGNITVHGGAKGGRAK